MSQTIFVSKTDSAAYSTITEALASIPKDSKTPVTISIGAGVYHEKLEIDIPFVTLQGESPENTIITYDDYARFLMPDGMKRGTFRSYTLFVNANHISLKNLTIENASGPSQKAGQAIALYADGDAFFCENCRLISCQDTLFTAPLPEKEYEPGGFRGPKEFAPRTPTRQYYRNCFICGDIDFIFGGATAYFERCQIHSILRNDSDPVQGYVTAASTPAGQPYGYVFYQCELTSDCPPETVYLGRPWRDYAKTVFLNCTYGSHINMAGFYDWDKAHARETVFYAEAQCHNTDKTPIDTSHRAKFVQELPDEVLSDYQPDVVLGDWVYSLS
ncbi:MAG: pectinesterase family protein [Roseburia sp.]